MATVRLLKDLMKDKGIGRRWVPIIPDEARTFGMDSLFPTAKIYSPHGQQYTPVDRELFLSYREATGGQILHEGINEAGSMASFTAAGSAYATHGEPMIPVYIFYSMFGFQRTGDAIWAAADQMARGFLLGATAGRTTLNGEGLQHEDGHSPLLAATNPAVVAYDPAFGFEVAHIVQDALRRMYGDAPENIIYYLTVYNEPISQPAEPAEVDTDGLLKGLYRYAPADGEARRPSSSPRAPRCSGRSRRRGCWPKSGGYPSRSGPRPPGELRRDAVAGEEHNLLHPSEPTGSVRHAGARRAGHPDHRGERLHAGGTRPDLALGAEPVHLAGHRRLRPLGHPARAAPALPRRRGVHCGRDLAPARAGRRRP